MKKKFVLILVFGLIAIMASAQEKYLYCELVGTGNLLGTKCSIVVDYGEQIKLTKPNWIRDSEGKIQKFNSMIDALNYMGDQGWEFVQAYAVTTGSNTHVYHYLLKRKVDNSPENN